MTRKCRKNGTGTDQTECFIHRRSRHFARNRSKITGFRKGRHCGVKEKGLDYQVGDRVRHIKFGEGTVKGILEGGRDFEVTVEFDTAGVKKMFATFAKLKKI